MLIFGKITAKFGLVMKEKAALCSYVIVELDM